MNTFKWVPYWGNEDDDYTDIPDGEGFQCRNSAGRTVGYVTKGQSGKWVARSASGNRPTDVLASTLKLADAMKAVEQHAQGSAE